MANRGIHGRAFLHALFCLIGVLLVSGLHAADRTPGFQPDVFALENVTAVVGTNERIEKATIILRNGVIQAIGRAGETIIPIDAEVIDGAGMFAYAGFLDAYSTTGVDSEIKRSRTGEGRDVDYGSFALGATPPDNRNGLTPEFLLSDALNLSEDDAEDQRSYGFTAALIAAGGGIATGQSCFVSLNGQPRREIIVQSPVGLHIALQSTGIRGQYPSTLMGYVAHLRQSMIDARHYDSLWQHFREYGGVRPPVDPTLETLRAAQTGKMTVFWAADTRDEIHRALDLADEFGVDPVIVGGSEAWRVADRLAAARVPVILKIDFPDEPTSTNEGRRGGRRGGRGGPMTPAQIRQALARPDLPDQFRERLQQRLQQAERAEGQQTGDSPQGRRGQRQLPESPRLLAELKRQWEERIQGVAILAEKNVPFCFSSEGHRNADDFHRHLRKCIELGLDSEKALAALTEDAATILGLTARIGKLAKGYAAHVVVFDGPFQKDASKLRYVFIDRNSFELNEPGSGDQETEDDDSTSADEPRRTEPGNRRFGGGRRGQFGAGRRGPGQRRGPGRAEESRESEPADQGDRQSQPDQSADDDAAAENETNEESRGATDTDREPYPTEIESDREPLFQTGGNVAIRNANILTVTGPNLPRGTIVIQDGKIAAVGETVEIPEGVHVIDAQGMYVMPGMIDTHSHISISNGTNESSLAVVPEVRVRDVVSGDNMSIYRAIGGGLTTARLLHGSANPIGGQDAVIKLRWGKAGRDLILRDAPRGVKFALGENPKRSSSRYPDTRLGVEAAIRRSFEEGRMYRRLWQLFADARSRGEVVPEPRRDLRLEALADVVNGELLIHCHCYRADEILMLLRLAESYGIRIKSLQHVLEGYKVAAEIAAHGASNSTFSDWWAYKVEAYDAIPHNAALLVQAGAHVTLKSDDSELMRHMNQEAAKTMRYGGLNEEQALRLVTINAAAQLGLEDRLGSIEVGKDADLAIFNGHPLNGFARCELTLIDGEVYFERKAAADDIRFPSPSPDSELRQAVIDIPVSASRSYALINARVVAGNGNVIHRGVIVVNGDKIHAVGGPDLEIPGDAAVVDLQGLSVFPGMISAGGTLGLTEIGSLPETQDFSERGQFNEDLRASIALNPDSEIIPVTRANGVLTCLTRPSGGVISGQSVLMNLYGWIPPEMSVLDPAALHINFPRTSPGGGRGGPRGRTGSDNQANGAERVDALKERFKLALRYTELQKQLKQNPQVIRNSDPKLQALARYAQGDGLVVIHANGHGDILAAIDFAEELKLNWVLSGATDAWKCVDELKEHDVKVILGPTMATPSGTGAPYDVRYRLPAMLYEAGVKFALVGEDASSRAASRARNLPFQAAMAAAYGLPVEEALNAVTLYPAQLLGVADRLGTIEPGKLANLVICDGHLLQPATQVKSLFIAGNPLAPTSRHTRLYARYQERLKDVIAGRAPLGVSSPLPARLVQQPSESPVRELPPAEEATRPAPEATESDSQN